MLSVLGLNILLSNMDLYSVVTLIFYSIPPVTALTSCMLLLSSYQEVDTPFSGSLRRVSLLFFFMSFLGSFGIMIFPYSAVFFAVFTPLHYGAFISVPIFLYHLIWILTSGKDGTGKSFPLCHYLFPLLIAVVLQIWSFFIPFDIQIETAEDRERTIVGYEFYSNIAHLRMHVRVAVNTIYLVLVLLRIRWYWNIVGHSKTEVNASNRWFGLLVALSIATFLAAFVGVLKHGLTPYSSIGSFVVVILLAFLHVKLVFRLIKGRFPLVERKNHVYAFLKNKDNVKRKKSDSSKVFDRKQFETWFKKHKPYLNPSYSISDLSRELNTNRTYMSNFINETYGVNFTRYLNQHRFIELRRLRKLPLNKQKTPANLFQEAGFGSYRSYLRIKSLMENNKEE